MGLFVCAEPKEAGKRGRRTTPRDRRKALQSSFEANKNRILELYEAAEAGEATVICLDEFGSLNIQPQFKALRYFTLDGTDHPDHATQSRLIRRYIAWRNHHADDARLRAVVNTANVV